MIVYTNLIAGEQREENKKKMKGIERVMRRFLVVFNEKTEKNYSEIRKGIINYFMDQGIDMLQDEVKEENVKKTMIGKDATVEEKEKKELLGHKRVRTIGKVKGKRMKKETQTENSQDGKENEIKKEEKKEKEIVPEIKNESAKKGRGRKSILKDNEIEEIREKTNNVQDKFQKRNKNEKQNKLDTKISLKKKVGRGKKIIPEVEEEKKETVKRGRKKKIKLEPEEKEEEEEKIPQKSKSPIKTKLKSPTPIKQVKTKTTPLKEEVGIKTRRNNHFQPMPSPAKKKQLKEKSKKTKETLSIDTPIEKTSPSRGRPKKTPEKLSISPKIKSLKGKGKVDTSITNLIPIKVNKEQSPKPKSILKKTIRSASKSPSSSKKTSKEATPSPRRGKSPGKQTSLEKKSSTNKFYSDLEEKYHKQKTKSPSKFNVTPMKVSSNKKQEKMRQSLSKAKQKINFDDINDKKSLLGRKRNISFSIDNLVKEFDPKTPVKDIGSRGIRKSPTDKLKKNKKKK